MPRITMPNGLPNIMPAIKTPEAKVNFFINSPPRAILRGLFACKFAPDDGSVMIFGNKAA